MELGKEQNNLSTTIWNSESTISNGINFHSWFFPYLSPSIFLNGIAFHYDTCCYLFQRHLEDYDRLNFSNSRKIWKIRSLILVLLLVCQLIESLFLQENLYIFVSDSYQTTNFEFKDAKKYHKLKKGEEEQKKWKYLEYKTNVQFVNC